MKALFRNDIDSLTGYHAPYNISGIKLDANENTYPVLEALTAHLSEWVKACPLNYYPDTDSTRLREVLAKKYDVEANQILCGVGSDQVIDCLMRAALNPGEKVVVPTPSFSMYEITALLNHGSCIKVPLNDEMGYDIESFEAIMCREQPKLTFICNPNNPTGTTMALEAIERLAKHQVGLLVVDEAYQEFGGDSAISLIKEYPHVVVLRTFSKAYGLAGLRVGYAVGSKEVMALINRIKPPYNLNIFTEEAARWVCEHEALFEPMIEAIKATQEDFRNFMVSSGYEVAPSETNFIWVKTEAPLDTWLAASQIHIKKFVNEAGTHYRISMGTKVQMEQVKQELIKKRQEEGTYANS